jgi:putative SOS response-associated peptidase YedK
MCGRYAFTPRKSAVKVAFDLDEESVPLFEEPRYNIAPTQAVPIVRQTSTGKRECVFARWGLIPSWAADSKIGYRLINARSEGVEKKPSFRAAFKQRRCLVVSSGFYEWQKITTKKKQPYFFQMKGDDVFGFAGLWESWHGPDGNTIETCTILTTDANELLRPVHERMPVILPKENYAAWLNPSLKKPDELLPLLRPFPAEAMEGWPVSAFVNSPKNQGPQCAERLAS